MNDDTPRADSSASQVDPPTMTRAAHAAQPADHSGTPEAGASLDQIRLTGLGGIGHHGVLPEERRDGQPFLADLVLAVDTRAAALGDDLARTVNYAEVAQAVVAVIEGEPVNLIETLAGRIAAVALAHEPVHAVTVTVHKPEAPVGVPFTDVEVTVTRTRADDLPALGAAAPEEQEPASLEAAPAVMPAAVPPAPAPAQAGPEAAPPEPASGGPDLHAAPDQPVPVVIALGGNIGDVRATLRAVVSDLRALPGLTIQEVSPLARTAPVLAPDAVAQPDFLNAVVLATTTMALLQAMQDLENAYGRRRTVTWEERTLDLDLIVYDGVTSTDPDLSLPHPRASERAFVLVPWAQADPDAFLPGLGGGPVASLAETAPDRGGVRWLALDWLEEPVRSAPASEQPQAAPPADGSAAGPAEESADSAPGAEGDAPDAPDEAAPDAEAGPVAAAAGEQAEPVGAHTGTAAGQESLEDLELLARGDAEPQDEAVPAEAAQPPVHHPQPPASAPQAPAVPPEAAVPPARPGRASFPPPVPPEPVESPAPEGSAASPASPERGVTDADPDAERPAGPSQTQDEEDQPEAAPAPAERDWFDADPSGPQDPSEPDLPWAAPQEESEAPRMAPKWQPLRRNTDT